MHSAGSLLKRLFLVVHIWNGQRCLQPLLWNFADLLDVSYGLQQLDPTMVLNLLQQNLLEWQMHGLFEKNGSMLLMHLILTYMYWTTANCWAQSKLSLGRLHIYYYNTWHWCNNVENIFDYQIQPSEYHWYATKDLACGIKWCTCTCSTVNA